MTVVEYDGRIVVVDVGLRFPTAEMVGIDLVLPDFTYLRERVGRHRGRSSSRTATRTTSGRCRSCCASWADRLPVYGGKLTMAMARSKLDEHKLRDLPVEDVDAGRRRSSSGRSTSS